MNVRPDELIEVGEITLRRYREDDVASVYKAVTESLDHLRPWMPWAASYSPAEATGFVAASIQDWDRGTAWNYAIVAGEAMAGSCGLMTRAGPGALEIGYWVHPAYTRRGLATAVSAALVEQAFRLPGIGRIEIVHDELNVTSGRIPARLEFTEIGRRQMDLPAPQGTGTGVVWELRRR